MDTKFYHCSRCQGLGVFNNQSCSDCGGIGVSYLLSHRIDEAPQEIYYLYFGKKIDRPILIVDAFSRIFNNTLRACLILFGISGFLVFLWPLFLEMQSGVLFDPRSVVADLLSTKNVWTLYFWISLLSDLYLISLFARDAEKKKYVLWAGYGATAREIEKSEQEDEAKIFPFEEFKKVPASQKIDVSLAYTRMSMKTLEEAWSLSKRLHLQETSPEILLAALLLQSRVRQIFARLGVNVETLNKKVLTSLMSQHDEGKHAPIQFSKVVKQMLLLAYQEAYETRQDQVDVESLLLAVMQVKENIAREILFDMEITEEKLRNVIVWFRIQRVWLKGATRFSRKAARRSKSGLDRAMTAMATPFLNQLSVDLTLAAKFGRLSPLIDREQEVQEIFHIIEGTGEGVLLVGHPGVGKTALAEGIAMKMVEDVVPRVLRDKRLVSLSIPKLVGGANPFEAEARLLRVIAEIQRARNIVLFVDNIQDMVGISAGTEGSLDLSEVLVSALQRHAFLCIATAPDFDYHRFIESHTAIGQVLHRVKVPEMEENAAIQVIEARTGALEYRHRVYFSYNALEAAVQLSARYMHDKFLPVKAITLIEEAASAVAQTRGEKSMVHAEDIARLISEQTKIPLTKITEKESARLLQLEEVMHERMVDQEEAVSAVASSLRRARVELRDQRRPIANFLFLGPTGVGKTECAKTVAEMYFGNEEVMIRVDMSEYQTPQSVDKLIGAPPGPSGLAHGGYFTEAVRKNPYSLILLDEVEKAHPEILNLFLQVMDDGRLTDATGRTIDFTQTIIIMTSNAATSAIQEYVQQGMSMEEMRKQVIESDLKQYFRPEFLNRLDMICIFRPLEPSHVRSIARLMLEKIGRQLDTRGIRFSVKEEAIEELAKAGFDPIFGARPLRRVIQEEVSNVLANAVLSGKLSRRDQVVLSGSGKIDIVKAKKL